MSKVFGASSSDSGSAQIQDTSQQQALGVIATGIPGFDEILGQGLPAGNLYLISGVLGSNASLFVQQILYNTLIGKAKVTYYTVEQASTDIIQDMQLYGMNVQQYVDDGSWVFARVLPANLKKIMEALPEVPMEQRIDVHESLSGLMNHFHDSAKEGRNTAIHLPYLIRNFSLEENQNQLLFMTGVARKYGGIHFLLLTEGAHDQSTVITIKDAVDSVFDVATSVRGSDVENVVTIQKIRNMKLAARIIRLAMRDNGLATETIRRVQ